MSLDRTKADAYFAAAAHVESATWLAFSVNQRAAAVAQAVAELTALKREELDDTTTAVGDYPREDAAVFEYAFNLLRNATAAGSGLQDSPEALALETPEARATTSALSMKVLAYLGITLRMSRG